ncbi:MAG: MFS transporter, partial [Pseudomonadales bacterium]|nr:MFS transporter [Pseudomonadales bacterium]
MKWYLGSTAFYLVPGGIQAVLFPWLIAVYLQESPIKVGIAQMAGPLPMLFLVLFGGWLGDRVDQRRLSVILASLLAVPPLIVAVFFYVDIVTYELLLCWVVLAGCLGAFAQPARDAMLNRVAGENVQGVVTLVIGVQFGIQILGFAIGSSADVMGPIGVLCFMSFFMMCSAVTTHPLPAMPVESSDTAHESPLENIKAGLLVAWRSEKIRPAIILIFGVGLFFASSYMVILPLMVRDIFDGGASGIAMAYASNMLGTCTIIFFVMRRGGIARPGRALILGGCLSSLVLSCLYFEFSELAFYGVIYVWGMCGGISMTLSRAIVQEASPPTHRARILSVYMLGMMGGMPIGSAIIGVLVEYMGIRNAVLVPGLGMLLIIAYLYLATSLYDVKRQP